LDTNTNADHDVFTVKELPLPMCPSSLFLHSEQTYVPSDIIERYATAEANQGT